MLRAKQYLLERAVRSYVVNVDNVLGQLSISRLMFGSVRVDEVNLVPATMQDTLFDYIFYGCEIARMTAYDVQVSIDWLSVSTRSIRIQARTLEIDLDVRDPANRDARPEFWTAQKLRNNSGAEAVGNPADITLSYKILSGLDIMADVISVKIRTPDDTAARMLVTLNGLRYCPATLWGAFTNDLDLAIRPNPELQEVGYSYGLEIKSLAFALPSVEAKALPAEARFIVEAVGLVLSSHGRTVSLGKRETPFYATGVLSADLSEIRAPGVVHLQDLASILNILSQASASDGLRDLEWAGSGGGESDCIKDKGSANCVSNEAASDLGCVAGASAAVARPGAPVDVSEDQLSKPSFTRSESGHDEENEERDEARRSLQQRINETRQSKHDMANFLKAASADVGEDDNDEFVDCEEFRLLELPDTPSEAGSPRAESVRGVGCQERLANGILKRSAFTLKAVNLQLCGSQGSLRVVLDTLSFSIDKRARWNHWQAKCISALFDVPSQEVQLSRGSRSSEFCSINGSSVQGTPLKDLEPGVTYAGVSLATVTLAFAPSLASQRAPAVAGASRTEGGEFVEVFQIRDGMQLRHQGCGELWSCSSGALPQSVGNAEPVQLIEVFVSDVRVCDKGREEMVAMAKTFSDSLVSSPEVPADVKTGLPEPAAPQVCIRVEAVDVCFEATLNDQAWRCTLPRVRLQSVLSGLDDIWPHVLWTPSHIRGMSEPLWTADPAARPYLTADESPEADSVASHASDKSDTRSTQLDTTPASSRPTARCWNSETASEHNVGVELSVQKDRYALHCEQERSKALEQRLDQLLAALRELPGGVPPSLHGLVSGAHSAAVAPASACSSQQSSHSRTTLAMLSGIVAETETAASADAPLLAGEVITRQAVEVTTGAPAVEATSERSIGFKRACEGARWHVSSVKETNQSPADGVPERTSEAALATTEEQEHALRRVDFNPKLCGATGANLHGGHLEVTTLVFELNPGKKVWHAVEGLQKGDSLEWAVEELHDKTIDVAVILRSKCKLHAARRLRETMRTGIGPFRDSFGVTDEFDDMQLPLALDIQLSNDFSWWADKEVRLTLWRLSAK
eukprot:TRINITY_DN14235_c0_g2_i1.p1 TRINITY_DN14235_c0_g2~~TRINITY_DN14235_c0_g2_i1.p1  ORF type:complete len:1087 (+),score=155.67 TRINITY_DN14235_c0_g2_i1:76-3336(+)